MLLVLLGWNDVGALLFLLTSDNVGWSKNRVTILAPASSSHLQPHTIRNKNSRNFFHFLFTLEEGGVVFHKIRPLRTFAQVFFFTKYDLKFNRLNHLFLNQNANWGELSSNGQWRHKWGCTPHHANKLRDSDLDFFPKFYPAVSNYLDLT